jgi:hypothetical protein
MLVWWRNIASFGTKDTDVKKNVPILVWQSSCHGDERIEVECDLWFLPEVPLHTEENMFTKSITLQCGKMSALLLDDMPFSNTKLLASLTSCRGNNGTLPTPSILEFSLQEKRTVEWNVTLDQLQDEASPTKIGFAIDESKEELEPPPPFLPHNAHLFYADLILASLEKQQQLPPQPKASIEILVALRDIQAMAEREALYLDRMLFILLTLGIFLLGLLFWSVYQLYCSTRKEATIHEIRQSLREKKQLLSNLCTTTTTETKETSVSLQSVLKNTLSRSSSLQPSKIDSHSLQQNEPRLILLVTNLSVNRQQVTNQKIVKTLLHSQGFEDVQEIDGADPSLREVRNNLFQISGVHANYPQLFLEQDDTILFVGTVQTVQELHDDGLLTRDYLGPQHTTTTTQNAALITPPRTNAKMVGPPPLSPCSKLAQDWTQSKSQRRSNRKSIMQPLAIQWNAGNQCLAYPEEKNTYSTPLETKQTISPSSVSIPGHLCSTPVSGSSSRTSNEIPEEMSFLEDYW